MELQIDSLQLLPQDLDDQELAEWLQKAVTQHGQVAQASPTGTHPATDKFTGDYNFDVELNFNKQGSMWNYSPHSKKLFIKMGHKIQFGFKFNTPQYETLYVRALPVFLDSHNFAVSVVRCYNHKNPDNKFNEGNGERANHLVWINHDQDVEYMVDGISQRLSVRVPLGPKPNGSDIVYKEFSFMCLNSCQRIKCPIGIVFTLEDENMRVLGRDVMNLKVCTGPNRDRKIEEKASEDKSSKKRKIDDANDELANFAIPVPKKIYKSVVQYAKFMILQLCEEEKRKPEVEEEEEYLTKYDEILRNIN